MSSTTKIVLIILAVAGGLGVVVCGGAAIWFYSMYQQSMADPENIRLFVTAPEQVKRGETFTIEIRIVNDADRPQVLDSIDIYDSYTEGVRIRRSTPAWRSSSHMFDFLTCDYQITIALRSEQIVTFDALALTAGDFEGDFDVCINNEFSFMTEVVRTIIEDPASPDS